MCPPPPEKPSPKQLDHWVSSALSILISTIETQTLHSHPSPRSKPCWTTLLTTLRKEFTKASRKAKKHSTQDLLTTARLTRLGYFKAIKRPKASYWADFFTKTTPHNIWKAKQFLAPRKTPSVPSLPDATDPVSIHKALLDHFFPPKNPLPPRGCLSRDPSTPPLIKDKIKHALSKSSPASAPGTHGIPYSV